MIAAGRTLRGYLATLANAHEQTLLVERYADPPTVHTEVWLGGSNEKVDGEWRWVTGPEGKEDEDKGKLFLKDGIAAEFGNWRSGAPNTSRGVESFLQWNHYLSVDDVPGTWNDQPVVPPASSGYFVEYDGA